MSFGENLQYLRIQNGLSQKQLSILLNTSQQHISQLEKNQREPNLQDLKALASIFEHPIDLLIQESISEYGTTNLDTELWLLLSKLSYNTKVLIRDLLLLISKSS